VCPHGPHGSPCDFFSLYLSLLCWRRYERSSGDLLEVIEDRLNSETSCGKTNIAIGAHQRQRVFRNAVRAVGVSIAIDQRVALSRAGKTRASDSIHAQQARHSGEPW